MSTESNGARQHNLEDTKEEKQANFLKATYDHNTHEKMFTRKNNSFHIVLSR